LARARILGDILGATVQPLVLSDMVVNQTWNVGLDVLWIPLALVGELDFSREESFGHYRDDLGEVGFHLAPGIRLTVSHHCGYCGYNTIRLLHHTYLL